VGWVTRAGYKSVEFIKQFEKRIAYFHIKDTLPEGKWTEVGKRAHFSKRSNRDRSHQTESGGYGNDHGEI
jgi:sugar phosphate isomerase/epimerase